MLLMIQTLPFVVLLVLGTGACHHTFIDLGRDTAEADAGVEDAVPDADSGGEDGFADGADADGETGTVLPPPPCGNGVVEVGGECDDGTG